jgi:hypothetical protein
MNETEEKGGGELRLNERFEMKRDGKFFIKKTKKKSTRKYFISVLLKMKFTSREMRLKKFIAKKTLTKRNSKSHPCNYFSMQWMKQKY